MSYAIVKVIYGVPLTEDCIDLINKWESDPNDENWFEDDMGTCGFESLYSASGPGTGYCGVELGELDSYENQPVSQVRMTPTAKEKKEAEEMVEKLHPELRKRAGKIDVYFVWSDS
jgi:hypothetical protein